MTRTSWLQRLYLRYFSRPVIYRDLFLFASEHPILSILEIGMGDGERIGSLLKFCQRAGPHGRLRYAALDPFESGGGGRLTLKAAHKRLQELGVKAHLIPGDVGSGIVRVAHTVLPSDIVIIDGRWGDGTEEADALERWLPRLCHSESGVFASTREGGKLVRIDVATATCAARIKSAA